MEEQLTHRSVSQLNKYRSCPEMYRLSYIDKVSNFAPAAWLAQGTAFHEAVEAWENSGRSPGLDISQTYVLSYDKQIEHMKNREPDLGKWLRAPKTKTEDDINNRRNRGIEQLQNYVDYAESSEFVIADIDEWTLATEIPFEIQIGKTLIKGAIDQILSLPDGYEVRDLKTGNREQGIIQLAIYVLAVEKIFGWPVSKASYFYAKDGKVVTVSRQELDRYTESYLAELFDTLEEGIQSRVFMPNPGSHCLMCPVKKFCREMGTTPEPLSEFSALKSRSNI